MAAFALALLGVASGAVAQGPTTAVQPSTVSAVSLTTENAAPVNSAGDIEITLPSVAASGSPRSFQVISIPIPEAFSAVMKLELEIVPSGDFTVVGPRTRVLPISNRRRVTATIGVPANALAGRLLAAEARFSSPASPTLVVPIEIDVSLVRLITLRPGTGPINGQAGNDVILPFDIINSGNAKETVNADLSLPSGWASREVHTGAIVIQPGETVKRRVRLKIPTLSRRSAPRR